MSMERLNLGEQPRLEITHCDGDLEVRGSARQDVVMESDGPPFKVATTENTAVVESLHGCCAIRMPEGGHLRIGRVSGQLRLKGILGAVEVEQLDGDCVARRIGSLSLGSVGGEAHLRRIEGTLTLGSVGGSVSLRDASAPVQIARVGGDFMGRDVPAGLSIEQISGDLALRSDVVPDAAYVFAVHGDALFRVPTDAGIRFVMPAGTRLRLDEGLQAVAEGESVVVTLGTGAATVQLSASGDVRIRLDDAYGMDDDYAFDEDFDTYMSGVSATIDAQMGKLEAKLEGLPDRIRERVGRKLDAARRKVESAQRDAQRATEGARRERGGWSTSRAAHQPVSEQERLLILQMLEHGTVTVEQAEKLLAALEGEGSEP